MPATFPVIETPTAVTPPTSGLKKVSHYFHINDENFIGWVSPYTSYAYRITSFVLNGVELITTPITSPFWTSQNNITIPAQPFERHLIPQFEWGTPWTWTYDANFINFMNWLSVPNFVFYPEWLSWYFWDLWRERTGNFYYWVDNIWGTSVDSVYWSWFQIERPENDIFTIKMDCLYNGSWSAWHTMMFANNANVLDWISIMSKYWFNWNTY